VATDTPQDTSVVDAPADAPSPEARSTLDALLAKADISPDLADVPTDTGGGDEPADAGGDIDESTPADDKPDGGLPAIDFETEPDPEPEPLTEKRLLEILKEHQAQATDGVQDDQPGATDGAAELTVESVVGVLQEEAGDNWSTEELASMGRAVHRLLSGLPKPPPPQTEGLDRMRADLEQTRLQSALNQIEVQLTRDHPDAMRLPGAMEHIHAAVESWAQQEQARTGKPVSREAVVARFNDGARQLAKRTAKSKASNAASEQLGATSQPPRREVSRDEELSNVIRGHLRRRPTV